MQAQIVTAFMHCCRLCGCTIPPSKLCRTEWESHVTFSRKYFLDNAGEILPLCELLIVLSPPLRCRGLLFVIIIYVMFYLLVFFISSFIPISNHFLALLPFHLPLPLITPYSLISPSSPFLLVRFQFQLSFFLFCFLPLHLLSSSLPVPSPPPPSINPFPYFYSHSTSYPHFFLLPDLVLFPLIPSLHLISSYSISSPSPSLRDRILTSSIHIPSSPFLLLFFPPPLSSSISLSV